MINCLNIIGRKSSCVRVVLLLINSFTLPAAQSVGVHMLRGCLPCSCWGPRWWKKVASVVSLTTKIWEEVFLPSVNHGPWVGFNSINRFSERGSQSICSCSLFPLGIFWNASMIMNQHVQGWFSFICKNPLNSNPPHLGYQKTKTEISFGLACRHWLSSNRVCQTF